MADGTVKIKVDWDDSGIEKGIKKTKKDIEKKLDDVEIKASVKADTKDIKELQKSLDSIDDVEIKANVTADTGDISDLQKSLDKIDDVTVKASITVDDSDIKQVVKQLDSLDSSVSPKISVDDSDIDQARKKLDDLGDPVNVKVNADTSGINFSKGTAGALGFVGAIGAVVYGTQEYNEQMAILETNAHIAGVSFEFVEEKMKQLNAVGGDTDQNLEAISNLLKAGFDEDTLTPMIEHLAGAVIQLPETVTIEGLSDSIQEMLASGDAAGQFGEVLNRNKLNIDQFEEGLRLAKESGTELEYVMAELNKMGLDEVSKAHQDLNPEIKANKDAQFELNASLANLGIQLMPLITSIMPLLTDLLTQITPILIQIVQAVLPILQNVLTILMPIIANLVTMLLPPLMQIIQAIVPPLMQIIQTILPPLLDLLIELILPLVDIVILYLPAFLQILEAVIFPLMELITTILPPLIQLLISLQPIIAILTEVISFFASMLSGTLSIAFEIIGTRVKNIIAVFQGLIDFIVNVFQGNWEGAWQSISNIFGDIFNNLIGIAKSPINAIIGLINGMISAINRAISGINGMNINVPDWVPLIGGQSWGFSIPKIPSVPYLARGGIVPSATKVVVGEDGAEAVIPLEKNQKGVQMIADLIYSKMNGTTEKDQIINLNVNLDSAVIYKQMVKINKKNTISTGKNALA